MKKALSLLAVAALLLCLMSSTAFAQAAIIIEGQTVAPGTVDTTDSAVIISDGQIIADPNNGGAAVVNNGNVTVSKNPTGERVDKGGQATFVAHAYNATSVTWRLVSSDAQEVIYAAAGPDYFSGLVVVGSNTDSLTLKNIPDSLNGWMAEAMFSGENGPVFTTGARITVNGSSANGTTTDKNPTGRIVAGVTGSGAPVISSEPTGAELTSGKSTTLSVTAGTNDGGKLNYQWYISASDDNTAGQAIAGATSASYTPGEIVGTRYYYVGVWSEKDDGSKSETAFSSTAAVTYSAPVATPTPTVTPSNTPTPATTANAGGSTPSNNASTSSNSPADSSSGTNPIAQPGSTEANAEGSAAQATPAVTEPTRSSADTGSSLPVVLGAIAAVAMAAGVGLLVLRRNAGQ